MDYWSTMSQVLPVLALGVILEARAITGRWRGRKARALSGRFRFVQSTIWVALLLALGYFEVVAVRSMADPSAGTAYVAWVPLLVMAAVAIVIISPAFEIFFDFNPAVAAGLFTLVLPDRITIWLLSWKISRQHGQFRHQRHRMTRAVADLEKLAVVFTERWSTKQTRLAWADDLLSTEHLDPQQRAAVTEYRDLLRATQPDLEQVEERLQDALHQHRQIIYAEVRREREWRHKRMMMKSRLRNATRTQRAVLVAAISDDPGAALPVMDDGTQPDDGGFLWPSEEPAG